MRGQERNCLLKSGRVGQEGRNILEDNARFGKIRDVPYELHQVWRPRAHAADKIAERPREAIMEFTVRPARPTDSEAIVDFNARLAQETEHLTLDPALLSLGV